TCQSELAIVHGPTLTDQLKKNPEQPPPSAGCRRHFLHGRTIEKGMARLRSSRLQRALRTESEPPKFLRLQWPSPNHSILIRLSPSKASQLTCPLAPRSVGSKADCPSFASGQKTAVDSSG